VKDFVADFRFELRSVGVSVVAAIRSARMLFDDARFPPDTDRATDMEVFASTPDCEHVVIFSINSAYCAAVAKYTPGPRLIIDTRCRSNSRRTLRSRSGPIKWSLSAMTESGHSSIALIIADMPSPPRVSDFELGPSESASFLRVSLERR
jgi:hypothetical protein